MDTLTLFGQLEYHPVQIAPPQPQYSQFPTPSQPSHSPHSTTPQPGFEPQQAHPIGNTARLPGYPPQSPFQWILDSFATLLQTQQLEFNVKFQELGAQHNALLARLDTIEQNTKTYRDDITSINSSLQTITNGVSQLGKDMASRDAMLAERLNALDDAIDPEGKILGPTNIPPQALQSPPESEVQINHASLEQGPLSEPVLQFQPAVLKLGSAPGTSKPDDSSASSPALPFDRSSSTLSSPEPSPEGSTRTTNNVPPPRPKAVSKALQKVKKLDLGVAESPRRSSRTPKKRDLGEAMIPNNSTPRKRKSTAHNESAKTPAKKPNLSKSAAGRFDWSTIPVRDESHLKDQLIQCETCDVWYHWTCVNIDPNDPMLQDENLPWACPPCDFEAIHDNKSRARTRALLKYSRCRPDCANDDHGPEKFIIESIIGRFPDYPRNKMQYLVKWENYSLAEATWTPEAEIGNAAPVLIRKFEAVAREEGHNLADWRSLILLKQASDAGWAWNQAPAS